MTRALVKPETYLHRKVKFHGITLTIVPKGDLCELVPDEGAKLILSRGEGARLYSFNRVIFPYLGIYCLIQIMDGDGKCVPEGHQLSRDARALVQSILFGECDFL